MTRIIFPHRILINWHSGFTCPSTANLVSLNQPFHVRILTKSNLWSNKVEGSLRKDQTPVHLIWPHLGDPLSDSFFPTCNTSISATPSPVLLVNKDVSAYLCQALLLPHLSPQNQLCNFSCPRLRNKHSA